MDLIYTLAKESDLIRLLEISSDIQNDYLKDAKEILINRIKKGQILCVKEGENIVGYLQWQNECFGKINYRYVEQITIIKILRKNKIGSALLIEFVKRCKKDHIRKIFADIQDYNIASLQLFKKAGFSTVGSIKGLGEEQVGDNRVIVSIVI